ncbi:hypothetical protein Cgig2_013591 [Carnegiea gigantea]|uniref:Uncharacterized protein n=1 Tax=Carnegiea gigantea TaxID=171969 RepID=A0A9Q1QFJ6_9CARY|nr:hypothetical protein Cgig2_013591 [Carnegiea gigantea]
MFIYLFIFCDHFSFFFFWCKGGGGYAVLVASLANVHLATPMALSVCPGVHVTVSPPFLSPKPPTYLASFHYPIRSHGHSRFAIGNRPTSLVRALREWKEYEEALRDKDLAKALKLLKSINDDELPLESTESTRSQIQIRHEVGFPGFGRDWEVLDTCLNADDMRLVGSAYAFLQDRGFLPNFGVILELASARLHKFGVPGDLLWYDLCFSVLEGPRDVTPAVLKSSTGLEVSKLSPKKWGVSRASSAVLFAFLGGMSFLLSEGLDLRPQLAAILGLAMADSIFLGGSCLAQISSYWPSYRRCILVHEAGHLLTAYLMGCPIRGVILDPIAAMQMGIQGQAGTQFWDENLQSELSQGRLSSTAFDRWAVLQSYNLLKWHKDAHKAAVKALEFGGSLSSVIRSIEDA